MVLPWYSWEEWRAEMVLPSLSLRQRYPQRISTHLIIWPPYHGCNHLTLSYQYLPKERLHMHQSGRVIFMLWEETTVDALCLLFSVVIYQETMLHEQSNIASGLSNTDYSAPAPRCGWVTMKESITGFTKALEFQYTKSESAATQADACTEIQGMCSHIQESVSSQTEVIR